MQREAERSGAAAKAKLAAQVAKAAKRMRKAEVRRVVLE